MERYNDDMRTSDETEKFGISQGNMLLTRLITKRSIWITNYVLMGYGTGAVMGVPAHDQRDFEFAKKYGIPIRVVIQPQDGDKFTDENISEAFTDNGIMYASGPFTGLNNLEGLEKVADYMEDKGIGKRKVNYRLRDWLISRQRYWSSNTCCIL